LLVTFDRRISRIRRDRKRNNYEFMITSHYEFMKSCGLPASALVPDFFLAHLDPETPDRPQNQDTQASSLFGCHDAELLADMFWDQNLQRHFLSAGCLNFGARGLRG
jgi:hypothetical protein